MNLQFFRLRFFFEAVDPLGFPPLGAGNTLRGALGYALREIACRCGAGPHAPDCKYARIFEPRRPTHPSGFAEPPRPFVLRARHLDGRSFAPGNSFYCDIHLFDLHPASAACWVEAVATMARQGIGAFRSRTNLISIEQLDTEDRVVGLVSHKAPSARLFQPSNLELDGNRTAESVSISFLTPTELKFERGLATRPEFSVLFARIRDRISLLRQIYGPGPLEIDFPAARDRAANIRMTRCAITNERAERRSSRTGQTHPLGGFTGEADYSGPLGEFLPYLQAARWTGVGRQTVWGKGEIALA